MKQKEVEVEQREPKVHHIHQPEYDLHSEWNDDNYEFEIAFTATKCTEHFNKKYKDGDTLVLSLEEMYVEALYHDLRSVLIQRAKQKLNTLVEQDIAFWKADTDMTEKEYFDRDERLYDKRGNRKELKFK
jgi:hypothetical protein